MTVCAWPILGTKSPNLPSYIEENHSYALVDYQAQKNQPARNNQPSQQMMQYWGEHPSATETPRAQMLLRLQV